MRATARVMAARLGLAQSSGTATREHVQLWTTRGQVICGRQPKQPVSPVRSRPARGTTSAMTTKRPGAQRRKRCLRLKRTRRRPWKRRGPRPLDLNEPSPAWHKEQHRYCEPARCHGQDQPNEPDGVRRVVDHSEFSGARRFGQGCDGGLLRLLDEHSVSSRRMSCSGLPFTAMMSARSRAIRTAGRPRGSVRGTGGGRLDRAERGWPTSGR